jgi:hypothetical protein
MIRRIAFAASAAVLALALPAVARAQAHFGISAGASIPESRFGESVNTGFNVNGMVNVTVPLSPLGFRGEVGFNHFDLSDNVGSGSVRMINGALNFILTPSTIMGAKPYLIGGVGAYNVNSKVSSTFALGNVFSSSSESSTRIGFNGGLGLTFGLGPVGTMLEARYVSVGGKNGSGTMTFVPVSFGITF